MNTPYSELPENKKEKMRKAHRKWAKNNPRKHYYNQYDKKRITPEFMMHRNAKSRATKKGVDFSINAEDIIIPDTCPICEAKLKVSDKRGGDSNSPSLDRIIPEKGYVKDNVAVICKCCNSVKSQATLDQLKRVVRYIETHINDTPL